APALRSDWSRPPRRRGGPAQPAVVLLEGGAHRGELRVGALAEEGDGDDAHHGDEGDEEGVLDERGPPVGLATGLEPGGGEVEGREHQMGFSSGTASTS